MHTFDYLAEYLKVEGLQPLDSLCIVHLAVFMPRLILDRPSSFTAPHMFASTLARVERAFVKLTGRKRERPSSQDTIAATAASIPAPIIVPEQLSTPAAAALGSPGSAFDRVTEDWAAARAAAQSSGGAIDDAIDDAHFAKRHRAMMSSAQERLQQAELEAREMRRKVPPSPLTSHGLQTADLPVHCPRALFPCA